MKDRNKIIIGLTSAAILIGVGALIAGRKKKQCKNTRLDKIADEGYETAGDILYPMRGGFFKKNWALN